MGNPEKDNLADKNFENINFEIENATASIMINHDNKYVWINDLLLSVKGQGYGSRLLDELKKKYPDFTIGGQASPTEFDRPEKPSNEEIEKAIDLGWSPASKADKEFQDPGFELTPDEKSFVKDVAERFYDWKKNESVPRLFNFYRKNGFELSPTGSGQFESKPPHKLRGEIIGKID